MNLSQENAAAAIQFLQRIQLAPNEIQNFLMLSQELNAIANPIPAAVPIGGEGGDNGSGSAD
jgi:hypothetical protein